MVDLSPMWFLRDDLSTFLKNRIEGVDWIVEQNRDWAIRIRCVKYVEALRQPVASVHEIPIRELMAIDSSTAMPDLVLGFVYDTARRLLRQMEAYERRVLGEVPTIDELDRLAEEADRLFPEQTGDEPTISPNWKK